MCTLTRDTNFRETYIIGLYVNIGEGTVKIEKVDRLKI